MDNCSINPYCHERSESGGHVFNEYFPISAVPLFATQSPDYQDSLLTVSNRANKAYRDFLLSNEGHGFNGQVRAVTRDLLDEGGHACLVG